jgi:ABC-type lipoprotein release transport system permease subunit
VLSIIFTNLRRRPARTLLTAFGIGVGVATIVALLSFTQGLSRTAAGFVHLGGSDLGVFQANVADPTASVLPQQMVGRLQKSPLVAQATPLLLIVEGIHREPSSIVFGADPSGFFSRQLVLLAGHLPRDEGSELLVGDRLAAQEHLAAAETQAGLAPQSTPQHLTPQHLTPQHLTTQHLTTQHLTTQHLTTQHLTTQHLTTTPTRARVAPSGRSAKSTLEVSSHTYRIAGVYHSGILFEDSGAVLGLEEARRLTGRAGEETDVVVRLDPRVHAAAATRAIERELPGTQAISDPEQALRVGANGTLISKAILVIVVIALIVGVIGVMNTMAMAIAERQTELGLLSTVGWSPARVAALILGEGIAVSVIGAALGLLFGVIGAQELVKALGVSSYVTPTVTAWGLGRGLLVGVAIGVLGGLYPAWRVTRMTPLKALSGT